MATKLTNVGNYTKNLAKSLGYATFDAVLQGTTLHEAFEDNKDVVKDIYQNIRDFAKDPKGTLKNNEIVSSYAPIVKEGFSNLLDDIKTGNIYNKDRADAAMMESFGAGEDFGFGDDFDFGDNDDFGFNESEEPVVDGSSALAAKAQSIATGQNIKAMDIIAKTNAKAISQSTARSAQYIVQAQQASTQLLMKQQAKIFNQVSVGLAGVNQNLGALVSLGEPLTAHMQNSMKFYTETSQKLDKVVNLLEGINKAVSPAQTSGSRKSYKGIDAFLTSGGALSLSGMKEMMGRNFGRAIDASPLGMLMGFQMGNDGKDMWRQMAANPLGTILTFALPGLLPKAFKDSVEKLGKTLAGFNTELISRLGKMSGSPLRDFIAGLFNYDDTLNKRIDTSKYNKGKVDFDGKTREAIIRVIPTYLAKILVALNGGFETRFDYDKGRFVNRQQIQEQYRNVFSDAADAINWDYTDEAEIKKLYKGKISDKRVAKIQADFHKYVENAIKTSNVIDPRELNKIDDDKARKYGFESAKQMRDIIMLYKQLIATGDGYKVNILKRDINRARLAISDSMNNASGDNIFTSLFDDSFTDETHGGLPMSAGGGGNPAEILKLRQEINAAYAKNAAMKKSKVKFSMKDLEKRYTDKNGKVHIPNSVLEEFKSLFASTEFHTDEEKKAFVDKINKTSGYLTGRYQGDLSGEDEFDPSATGFKKVGQTIRRIIQSPLSVVTSILNKADKTLFEVLYGKVDEKGRIKEDQEHNSVLGIMFQNMKDMFTTFKDWMKEKILDPIKNWFDDKGGFKGIMSTIFGIDVDTLWDVAKTKASQIGYNVKENFKSVGKWSMGKLRGLPGELGFGSGSMISARGYYGGASKDEGTKSPSKELLLEAFHMINSGKSIAETARTLGINYKTLQRKNQKENPRYEINKKIANLEKRSKEIIDDKDGLVYKTGSTMWNGMMEFLHHIVPDNTEIDRTADKAKEVVKTSMKSLGVDPSGAITGALMGGGLSILSGGVISPMLAASIGGAAGLVIKSDAMQRMLFGDELVDEAGNKTGKFKGNGMLSEKLTKFLTEKLPNVGGFTVAGGLAGLIPGMPGGPIGGMFIGSALGFAKNSDTIQEFLFGDAKKGTTGILGTEEDKKAKAEWLKRMAPKALAGAIGMAIAGPFNGIVMNAMVGSALGFASETETFKRALFGEEEELKDENGNVVMEDGKPVMVRKGGLAGLIKKEVLSPLGKAMSPIATELKHNAKSIIHNTGRMIAWAFSKTFASVSRPLWDKLGTFVLGPMAKVLGTTFKGVTKIATAPFKLIGAYGDHLKRKQIRGGYATYMSAKDRHEFMVQRGWKENGFFDADASMMGMESGALSDTLGDINSLLNVTERHTAQNNYNRSAVKVGNIVRKIASYGIAKNAQEMAYDGSGANEIIRYIKEQGVNVSEDAASSIRSAIGEVSNARSNLGKYNNSRAEMEAKIRKDYNLKDSFKLNDKNLLRLQESTQNEISLRNAKGDRHVGAVNKSVQETLHEVVAAHGRKIDQRMIDILNAIYSLGRGKKKKHIPGGTDDVPEDNTTEETSVGGNEGSPFDHINASNYHRGLGSALHSMWNPMHDMDEKSTQAAIKYYECVTLGKGSIRDVRYSPEEAGVENLEQLANRVKQIDGREDLIKVIDKNYNTVNLHKIGNVWYYASAHNIMQVLQRSRAGKMLVGGIKAIGRLGGALIRKFDPYFGFDHTWAIRVMENYDKSRIDGETYDDALLQYVLQDPDFPDGDVVELKDPDGHRVKLRKKGNKWIHASSAWLAIHRGLNRAGNLIRTGITSAVNFVKGAANSAKKLYGVVRRKIDPFYDFAPDERRIIEGELAEGIGEHIMNVGGGAAGIFKVVFPGHPTFFVDCRKGKPKYISVNAVKMAKARAVVSGIGGKISSMVGGIKSLFQHEGSGSGLIPAARYYRGGGIGSTIVGGLKSFGGKAASWITGKLSGEGDDSQSFLEKILTPQESDGDSGMLSGLLTKINSSKFNPKNFMSGTTDFNLGSKEAREAFRKDQARLNVFRETTFVTQQISQKMDILLNGLLGISASGSSGNRKKGGSLGKIAALVAAAATSAALWGSQAAILNGKFDEEMNGAYGSVNHANSGAGEGGQSGYRVTYNGKVYDVAVDENKQPIKQVNDKGEMCYVTTSGELIPIFSGTSDTLAQTDPRFRLSKDVDQISAVDPRFKKPLTTSGQLAKTDPRYNLPITAIENLPNLVSNIDNTTTNPLVADGTQDAGFGKKYGNKLIKDLLIGRSTPLGLLAKAESKFGIGGKIFNKLPGTKWKTTLTQAVESAASGATRRNWMSKLNNLPGISKLSDMLEGTWLGNALVQNATKLNGEEATKFTYQRFKDVFGKDANVKWLEYQKDGMETFLKNNGEALGKDADRLFKYADDITEASSTKLTKKVLKEVEKEGTKETGSWWSRLFKKGSKEAVEEGTETAAKKGVKEAGGSIMDMARKSAIDSTIQQAEKNLAQEATEKVAYKQVANTLSEAVGAAGTALSSGTAGKLIANAGLDVDTASKFVKSASQEFGKEMAKEGGEAVAKKTGKKVVGKIPIAGWIFTAAAAIYEFEEGWNKASRIFRVVDPTAGEHFISGIIPFIAELVATGLGVPVDFLPYDWIMTWWMNKATEWGYVGDDYAKRRDEFYKKYNEYNAKRKENGQEAGTEEEFVTAPKSVGGLDQHTAGEVVGAKWENHKQTVWTQQAKEEQKHAEYLNKLYNNKITREQYKAEKSKYSWQDPGDMGETSYGETSSLNHLLTYFPGWLEANYPNYKDFYYAYDPKGNLANWDNETGAYIGPMTGKGSMLLRGKGFISQLAPGLSNMKFGGTTFGQNGCAPAVASMLTGMPVGAAAGYAANGGFTNAGGTSADYFGNLFAQNGIPSEYVFTGGGSAQDYLESRIASGSPTVLLGQDYGNTSKANSPFGPGGHYVLATGEDSRGNIIIQDPEANRPNITYDRSILNSVKLGIPTGGASRIARFAKSAKNRIASALRFRGMGSFNGINEDHKAIWTFLVKTAGLSEAGAAGLMGCWQAESSCSPKRVEADYLGSFPGFDAIANSAEVRNQWAQTIKAKTKGVNVNLDKYLGPDGNYYPGFGLAQWTGTRGYNLLDYARGKTEFWGGLRTQLDFALQELKTKYSGIYSILKQATDPKDACLNAYLKYEGGPKSKTDWINERQGYAVTFYNEFSGKTYSVPAAIGNAPSSEYVGSSEGNASVGSSLGLSGTSSESSTTGGFMSSINTAINDHFAGILGELGEAFGIVHSSKSGSSSGSSEYSSSGSYGGEGGIINPSGDKSTSLKPLPALNSSHAINFVNAALSQKGYVETPDNITDFGKFTGMDGQPWCASFVSWAMNKAFGGDAEKAAKAMYGGPTAAVQTLWDRFKQNNAMSSTPAVGDIIIYKKGTSHTGIVTGVNGNMIDTVEGNTSGDASFSRNGGMVWVKNYDYTKKGNLTGFGRPNWAAIPEEGGAYGTGNSNYGDYMRNKELNQRTNHTRGNLVASSTNYGEYMQALHGSGSGLYNVAQAGYNTINRKHKRAKSVFGSGSGVVNLSRMSDSQKAHYMRALRAYAGGGSVDNDTMITLVKGIISLLSNVSANSDRIGEVVSYLQNGSSNNMQINMSTTATDAHLEDTDATIKEMQQLLSTLASGA